MVAAANLVEVAALVGDTARATMLNALMGGQALTACPSSSTAARHFGQADESATIVATKRARVAAIVGEADWSRT